MNNLFKQAIATNIYFGHANCASDISNIDWSVPLMGSQQFTPLQERLNNATPYILADRKIWKRLRYNHAIRKCGKLPTDKQGDMIAKSIMPYIEREGVTLEDMKNKMNMIVKFYNELEAIAWKEGDMFANFKVLKHVAMRIK